MSSATVPGATAPAVVEHAVCLGCGCACDDIDVVVADNRIVEARRACPLGVSWFGDGSAPAEVRVGGRAASIDAALEAAAALLAGARRPLVYLAPELSSEAQREAVAVADLLRAVVDSVTSATAMPSLLAAQERGRASGTLGEVRNRADVLVCWGVEPAERYPRYPERYAPAPEGMQVPEGRRGRKVVAVDVGDARGPADADLRVAVPPDEEVATLTALRALALEAPVGGRVLGDDRAGRAGPVWERARALAAILHAGRYTVIVADAEPGEAPAGERSPERASAVAALAQALNTPTRAALSTLRAGGNRSGADAALSAQTGYPAAVDFARGYPRYLPDDAAAATRLARGAVDAALVVGATDRVPEQVAAALAALPCAVIGPRATAGRFAGAAVAVDTGVAGIHEAGTALRMDDVPLPLRPSVSGPPDAAPLVRRLAERVHRARRGAPNEAAAAVAAGVAS